MTISAIPPSGPQSEGITVAAGAATLTYVPDFSSISIPNYLRIYEGTVGLGQFKVTPGSAVLAFNTGNNGASLTVSYNVATASGVEVGKVNEIISAVNALEGEDPESILTTKGDLIGRSATDPARIAVGANDLPLVADSAAAQGLSYKALPIAGGGTGQITQTAGMDALSPTTTKGDLLVDDGANVVRLPVGANDEVLTADSAQAAGVKWAAPSSSQVAGAETFLASGNFTVPAGVTRIKARMLGAGGGGAGGGGVTTVGPVIVPGVVGSVGGDSWVAVDTNNARGGLGGAPDGNGALPANYAPALGADFIKFGVQQSGANPTTPPRPGFFQVSPGAGGVTGAPPANGGAGTAGTANLGNGGGYGSGADDNLGGQGVAGGNGGYGEYVEFYLSVTPAAVVPVTVGAGGAGGAGGVGADFTGGAGGAGGSGFVVIEW